MQVIQGRDTHLQRPAQPIALESCVLFLARHSADCVALSKSAENLVQRLAVRVRWGQNIYVLLVLECCVEALEVDAAQTGPG